MATYIQLMNPVKITGPLYFTLERIPFFLAVHGPYLQIGGTMPEGSVRIQCNFVSNVLWAYADSGGLSTEAEKISQGKLKVSNDDLGSVSFDTGDAIAGEWGERVAPGAGFVARLNQVVSATPFPETAPKVILMLKLINE